MNRRTGRSPATHPQPIAARRSAFTLLEVLLAIGLFLTTITVVAQLAWQGHRATIEVQRQNEGMLRCQTVMGQLLASPHGLRSVAATPLDRDARWYWSSTVADGPRRHLQRIDVSVWHNSSNGRIDARTDLSRFFFVANATDVSTARRRSEF